MNNLREDIAKKVRDMLKSLGPDMTFEEARRVAKEYAYKLRQEGKIAFSEGKIGRIPKVFISRRTVPEAWEDITMALIGIGMPIHTHYDDINPETGGYTGFPSLDATVMMDIEDPRAEPRFHQHFLGGWMGFGDYKAEIEGVKDHWMISPDKVISMIRGGPVWKNCRR